MKKILNIDRKRKEILDSGYYMAFGLRKTDSNFEVDSICFGQKLEEYFHNSCNGYGNDVWLAVYKFFKDRSEKMDVMQPTEHKSKDNFW
jgi:hypothetical protein